MAFYYQLTGGKRTRRRVARRLLALREQLDREIPCRTRIDTLLLATWNIREFDTRNHGIRSDESMCYIAEIVSRFDLVAVQEVRHDLKALKALVTMLGPWWKYVVTDVTRGTAGHGERLAYVYDSRKVDFGGLAGDLVLPPRKEPEVVQFARTPFLAGFEAGWFRFALCTVHVIYGGKKKDAPRRLAEMKKLAATLAEWSDSSQSWSRNLILLGDFNIFDPTAGTFKALLKKGFTIPEELQALPSNVAKDKHHYDQVAFRLGPDRRLELLSAGVFDFYESVYRDRDDRTYRKAMGDTYYPAEDGKVGYYEAWRTYQMSDHLPMWTEFKIEFGEEYLRGIVEG
jgi:endonuclease/exonuclease/phosphatase family metal-dependent hydrolase